MTGQSVECYLTGKGREQAIFHLPFVEENHKIGIGQPNGFAFTIIMANILRFCQSSPISRCSVLEAYSESLISSQGNVLIFSVGTYSIFISFALSYFFKPVGWRVPVGDILNFITISINCNSDCKAVLQLVKILV